MELAFINANLRPTFVFGRLVYEVNTKGDTAANMVAIFNAGQKEFCTPEARAASRVIEAFVKADVSVADLSELEASGDPRVCISNKKQSAVISVKLSR